MTDGNFPEASRCPTRVPLLLLPGTLCDARVFEPLLASLAERPARVIVSASETSVSRAAKQILDDAPPRFALAGFSLGGIVALEIAAIAPERVAGLALISSNARHVPREFHAERRREALLGAEDLDRYVRETMWPRYVGPASTEDLALQNLIAAMAVESGAAMLANQIEVNLSRSDSRPRLHRLIQPSLILAGSEDALCVPEMQSEMAALLPNATLVMIPGAGHFALLEKPAAVAGPVEAWLRRVDGTDR